MSQRAPALANHKPQLPPKPTKSPVLTSTPSQRAELVKKCLFPAPPPTQTNKPDADSLDFNLLDEIYAEIEDKLNINRNKTPNTSEPSPSNTKPISQLVREAALNAANTSPQSRAQSTRSKSTKSKGQESHSCSSLSCSSSSSSYTSANSSHSNSCSCSTAYSSSSCGIASSYSDPPQPKPQLPQSQPLSNSTQKGFSVNMGILFINSSFSDSQPQQPQQLQQVQPPQPPLSTSNQCDLATTHPRPPLPNGPPPPLASNDRDQTTTPEELSLEEEITRALLLRSNVEIASVASKAAAAADCQLGYDAGGDAASGGEEEEDEDEYLEPILLEVMEKKGRQFACIGTFDESFESGRSASCCGADEDRNNTTNPYCVPEFAFFASTPVKADAASKVTGIGGSPHRLKSLFKLGANLANPLGHSYKRANANNDTSVATTTLQNPTAKSDVKNKIRDYKKQYYNNTTKKRNTINNLIPESEQNNVATTPKEQYLSELNSKTNGTATTITTPITPKTPRKSLNYYGGKLSSTLRLIRARSSHSVTDLADSPRSPVQISGPVLISQTFDLSKQNLIEIRSGQASDSKFSDHISMCSFSSRSSSASFDSASGPASTIAICDTIITDVYEEDDLIATHQHNQQPQLNKPPAKSNSISNISNNAQTPTHAPNRNNNNNSSAGSQSVPQNADSSFQERKKALGNLFGSSTVTTATTTTTTTPRSTTVQTPNEKQTGNSNGYNNNNSNNQSSERKPAPPKPPPRLDVSEGSSSSHKTSNFDLVALNQEHASRFLSLVNEEAKLNKTGCSLKGESERSDWAQVTVTSIKYNDKYIHDKQNRLVCYSREQRGAPMNCNCLSALCGAAFF